MHRFIIGIFFAASLACGSVLAAAADSSSSSLSSVLQKITDARGGAAVLAAIKSQTIVQDATLSGQKITATATFAQPNRIAVSLVYAKNPVPLRHGYDGTTAWESDSYGDVEIKTGASAVDIRCSGVEANPTSGTTLDKASTFSLGPDQTIGGTEYIVLNYTPTGCPLVEEFVNPDTWLVDREISAGVTLVRSAFKKSPMGETYPSQVAQTGSGTTITSTITSIVDNPKVDASMFVPPATPAPAPSSTPH